MFVLHPVAGSDDSSDNEPLIKMKTSAQAKKTEKKEKLSKSNGTNTKKTGGCITVSSTIISFFNLVFPVNIFAICIFFRPDHR